MVHFGCVFGAPEAHEIKANIGFDSVLTQGSRLGGRLDHIWPFGASFVASWAPLSPLCRHLGASLESFVTLAPFGHHLGALLPPLAPLGRHFGIILCHLASVWR